MKKIEKAAKLMAEQASLFWCPICQKNIHLEGTAVACNDGHQFDFAKKGYVNFYGKPSPLDYDRSLFEARYEVIQRGMYDQLHDKITEWLKQQFSGKLKILDVGCGEGSHLKKILDGMGSQALGIGIDIAKDGIITAAKYHDNVLWTVADLAKSPFQMNRFDIILNILSPANYLEFSRIVSPGGAVIKVIPNKNYLIEMRDQLTDKVESYSNQETIEHFNKHFSTVTMETINYQWKVPQSLQGQLWHMTPLTWGKKQQEEFSAITIDLTLLIGQNV
ncbi:putative RNA methyltransferase [Gracilibacillus kekensis]|uniref:23S rRNA m(1)G-748 methyltransferase n=1 Tax=Gracilibacillus kekensis TaxID=1027249 RepID=A0A1M7QI78_9BACI|nr:methyltransferase domain-containing protein [Gracilibacillus kekensis]SHN30779.1 23S rRNA m(1)G-748 methyltransferase [Gracilibacillus kekensis]